MRRHDGQSLVGKWSAEAPPPPHDPGERKLVAEIGAWQVRTFRADDRKFQYFLPRGFLHAQLWHGVARISVLTPSRLTGGLFEVFPVDDWKVSATAASVHRIVAREHGVDLPSLTRIAAIIEWYVRAEERRGAQGLLPLRPATAVTPTRPSRRQEKGRSR